MKKTIFLSLFLKKRYGNLASSQIIATRNRLDICRVVKSLVYYRKQRHLENKPFSDYDTKLLKNLVKLFDSEFSLFLAIPLSDVGKFIYQRTGINVMF